VINEKKFLDQEGVKYLWSKISMEDYPNNETLMAVINAIDETKADKDELFSRDYNDLENKPNIIDNQSDSLEIADILGNVILKVNKDGISSTQLFLNN
jgi:hypothetical protein